MPRSAYALFVAASLVVAQHAAQPPATQQQAARQQRPAPPPPQLGFTPYHATGIYDLHEKAGWTLTRLPDAPADATYTYTIKTNNTDTIKTGTLDFSSGPATIETSLDHPAMLYVEIKSNNDKPPVLILGAAIAPTKIEPSVPRPADFDSFWEAKLKSLSEIPINPVLTRTETTKPGVELYTFKLDSVGSHVQGYVAKPARDGKFPALILYQYAGVYALNVNSVVDRAAEGWLVIDVDSHDMLPTESTGPPRNYNAVGNASRETSYFLNMYLRDQRAIDYITSRPDWDGKTLVAMGTSMGGQQSIVAAGLSSKITAVIVNEPSGADSNGDLHGRKAGYPNWKSDDPKVMETGLYFDIVNFASKIKAPVLCAVGFIDTTATPVGIWAAFNQIPGPKEMVSMVESAHNNLTPEKQGAYNARYKEVLSTILNGGEFKPQSVNSN